MNKFPVVIMPMNTELIVPIRLLGNGLFKD
jgi:hypothetical protein